MAKADGIEDSLGGVSPTRDNEEGVPPGSECFSQAYTPLSPFPKI
jgi:hypothetical protein